MNGFFFPSTTLIFKFESLLLYAFISLIVVKHFVFVLNWRCPKFKQIRITLVYCNRQLLYVLTCLNHDHWKNEKNNTRVKTKRTLYIIYVGLGGNILSAKWEIFFYFSRQFIFFINIWSEVIINLFENS